MLIDRRRVLVNGALLPFAGATARGATSERIVLDPATGFALFGFDPVEYFLAGEARPGLAGLEAAWSGATFRFRSAANRAAFQASPQVYAPGFGGHDPVAAARGFAVPGDPLLFAIHADRLLLFRTPANRFVFRDEPEGYLAQATRNWPRLAAGLAR